MVRQELFDSALQLNFRLKGKISMRFFAKLFLLAITFSSFSFAQVGRDGTELTPEDLKKVLGIEDRAGGTHNASNIGLFFENRGKLYPRRLTDGPSGEFPINSTTFPGIPAKGFTL